MIVTVKHYLRVVFFVCVSIFLGFFFGGGGGRVGKRLL